MAHRVTPSRLLGIHQDEQDAARLRAAIDPSMIGRLLDDDIACLHVDDRVVQHHVNLAGQDNGIINGSGAMHHWMLHGKAPRWRVISDDLHHEIGVHPGFGGGIERRKLDHSDLGAVVGRR